MVIRCKPSFTTVNLFCKNNELLVKKEKETALTFLLILRFLSTISVLLFLVKNPADILLFRSFNTVLTTLLS